MIYLITGNMGTGKTSRAVNMILTNEDGLFTMTLDDGTVIPRPLYFCHIDGLDTAKFNAHELTKEQIQAAPLDEILPTGAVLIVDEAHWTYPVRAAAKTVPPYVQKLSELRHDGFTLILLTQHPSQLDIFVRNLVSKHIHLERKAIGMKQYWWYKCVTSLDNPAALSGTESAQWRPPKAAFQYYKSASKHQKFKKEIPLAVWALIAILGVVIWKGISVYGMYDKHTNPNQDTTEAASAPAASSVDAALSPNDTLQSTTHGQSLTSQMYIPTLAEKPESKPLYDGIRQVKSYERIAGCVESGKQCTCYSDQATELAEITTAMCKNYIKKGMPFDPFRENHTEQPPKLSESKTEPQPQHSQATVLTLGGKAKYPEHDYPPNLQNIQ